MLGWISASVARLVLRKESESRTCSVCGKPTKFRCSCGAAVHPRCARTGEHHIHLLRGLEESGEWRKRRN